MKRERNQNVKNPECELGAEVELEPIKGENDTYTKNRAQITNPEPRKDQKIPPTNLTDPKTWKILQQIV